MEVQFLLMGLILFIAGMVQGMIGFGFGLVSMSLLVLAIDLKLAVPLVAVFSLVVQIQLLSKLWPHLRWKRIRTLLLGAVVGAPIGVQILRYIDSQLMLCGLGALLIGYVVMSLWGRLQPQENLSENWGIPAGLAGGVLGGALNTSGPPVVVYVSMQNWEKNETTCTLQTYFFFVTVTQLIALGWTGLLSEESLWLNAKLFLPVIAGVGVGMLIYKKLNQESFRRWMLYGILVIGLNLFVRNLGFF